MTCSALKSFVIPSSQRAVSRRFDGRKTHEDIFATLEGSILSTRARIAEIGKPNYIPDIKSHPKASTTVRLRATRGRTLHEHALPELTALIDPASIFRLDDLPVPGTRIRLE